MLASTLEALHAIPTLARRAARSSSEALYTIYLFSESNVTGVLLPAVPRDGLRTRWRFDMADFFEGFLWLELHLLAFEVTGVEEDKLQKPHRPIPSGRIAQSQARTLYICVIIAALAMSARHGIACVTVIFIGAITVYNEGCLARFWYFKSGLALLGYAWFCSGTAICFNDDRPLPPRTLWATSCLALIFFTTGHAQDFRDREGDAAIGRRTLALILPHRFARWSLSALIVAWAAAACRCWAPPLPFSMLVCALAGATALSFLTDHSQEADKQSYCVYNLWLSCNALPLFDRWREHGASSTVEDAFSYMQVCFSYSLSGI
ncbi:UbiA prenyltransferase family-domain-containing protein [Schizophyllum fasciatum]